MRIPKGRIFWITSGMAPGLPLLGYLGEQTLAQYLGPDWAKVPWGWLFLVGLAIWLGYLIYDLTDPESKILNLVEEKRRIAEIRFRNRFDHKTSETFVSARLIFLRHAENVAVYMRYAHARAYIDGTWGWEWSEPAAVLERRDFNKDEEFTIELAQRDHDNSMRVQTPAGEEELHQSEGTLKFQISITTKSRSQVDEIAYDFPVRDMLEPVEVHPDHLTKFDERG